MHADVSKDRKREEFVPLVVPLLDDRSRKVRRITAWLLVPWTAHLSAEEVARSLLEEKDSGTQSWKKLLLRRILEAKEKDKE